MIKTTMLASNICTNCCAYYLILVIKNLNVFLFNKNLCYLNKTLLVLMNDDLSLNIKD